LVRLAGDWGEAFGVRHTGPWSEEELRVRETIFQLLWGKGGEWAMTFRSSYNPSPHLKKVSKRANTIGKKREVGRLEKEKTETFLGKRMLDEATGFRSWCGKNRALERLGKNKGKVGEKKTMSLFNKGCVGRG